MTDAPHLPDELHADLCAPEDAAPDPRDPWEPDTPAGGLVHAGLTFKRHVLPVQSREHVLTAVYYAVLRYDSDPARLAHLARVFDLPHHEVRRPTPSPPR